MAFRFRGGGVVHVALWSGLAITSLALSAPKIHQRVFEYSLHHTGPFQSSDSFLNFAAGAPAASEKLISIFQALPSAKTVVILTRKDDPLSSNLAMTTAYLASPHPVCFIETDGMHPDNQLWTIDRASIAALVFCRVSRPAWMKPGQIFGSGLEVVSRPQK